MVDGGEVIDAGKGEGGTPNVTKGDAPVAADGIGLVEGGDAPAAADGVGSVEGGDAPAVVDGVSLVNNIKAACLEVIEAVRTDKTRDVLHIAEGVLQKYGGRVPHFVLVQVAAAVRHAVSIDSAGSSKIIAAINSGDKHGLVIAVSSVLSFIAGRFAWPFNGAEEEDEGGYTTVYIFDEGGRSFQGCDEGREYVEEWQCVLDSLRSGKSCEWSFFRDLGWGITVPETPPDNVCFVIKAVEGADPYMNFSLSRVGKVRRDKGYDENPFSPEVLAKFEKFLGR